MSDAWRVELTRAAERDLRRLDPQVRRRAIDTLDGLKRSTAAWNIRRLAGCRAGARGRVVATPDVSPTDGGWVLWSSPWMPGVRPAKRHACPNPQAYSTGPTGVSRMAPKSEYTNTSG